MIHGTDDGKDVLNVCETLELACAELYHYFAELFQADRESFLLWLKAAMEEENHARLFALVGKLRCGGAAGSEEVGVAAANTALGRARTLIEEVRATPPSMMQALQVAIDLETTVDGFWRENLTSFADDACGQSLLSITAAGSKQLESLRDAYGRWSAA